VIGFVLGFICGALAILVVSFVSVLPRDEE
jgi:hypothetical protein